MKIKDINFRMAYHNFFYISGNEFMNNMKEHFPNSDNADGLLVYGYIDHYAGLTYELICCARKDGDSLEFFGEDNTSAIKLRAGSISDCDAIYIDKEENSDLLSNYSEKVNSINIDYSCGKDVSETRKISLLDSSRHALYPDDVKVFIFHGKNQPECCWVRCEGIKDGKIFGNLLNEPNQNMNIHIGETIYFNIVKSSDNIFCIADIE